MPDRQVLISSDSHIMERPELWVERLSEPFRERLPAELQPQALAGRAAAPEPEPTGAPVARRSHRGHAGAGTDRNKRVAEMDRDGISAEVIYPTKASQIFRMEDAELQEACFRAYNDELLDYCSVAPDRLYGLGLISVYNVDNAIKELERCRTAGMVGASVWMTPHPDLPFSRSDHYDRFWAAAQDFEAPISLHAQTGFDGQSTVSRANRPQAGAKSYVRTAVNKRIDLATDALLDLVYDGTLERYPRLRIVIAECEIGWLPTYLTEWDLNTRRFSEFFEGDIEPHMSLAPSEYFARQIYATFLEDEVGAHSLSWWKTGQENCMWSTDFPHSRTSWPYSRELIKEELGFLPQGTITKIVHDNVIRLYGLEVPEQAA